MEPYLGFIGSRIEPSPGQFPGLQPVSKIMGRSTEYPVYIVVQEPERYQLASRHVSLQCRGKILYSEMAMDIDDSGRRSEIRALENFIEVLYSRLTRVLDPDWR